MRGEHYSNTTEHVGIDTDTHGSDGDYTALDNKYGDTCPNEQGCVLRNILDGGIITKVFRKKLFDIITSYGR